MCTASPTRRARDCSADGPRRSTSSRACRWRRCPTSVPAETYISGGCGLITAVHAIDRAALIARRHRARAGHRRRRSQRDRARAAGRRHARHRVRRARRSARRSRLPWAPIMSSTLAHGTRRARADRARPDRRPRRRRRHRGGRIGARGRGGAESDPRRRTLRHRRPLHRRRAQRDQRAPADQPQAPRDSRLLGQRGRRTSSARCACSNVTTRRFPGARSAPGPTRSRNSIRRSPTPKRCVSRRLLSNPAARFR